MNQDTRDDIDRILSTLEQDEDDKHTTDTFDAREQPAPMRFIDVHIYELPAADDLPGGERTREEQEPAHEPHQHEEQEQPQEEEQPGMPAPRRRHAARLLAVGGVCGLLALLGTLIVLFVLPLLTPPVTITIVPVSRHITTTAALAVNGPAANGASIPGRAVAAMTMSQQTTVPTTGKGHQEAQAAHGTLTFYNAATLPQTIPAGTLLTDVNGVQIVTDRDAFLPAGTLATNGQATVPAHAVQAGPGGNIQAATLYGPCCRVNVLVTNAAFRGGQPARDYPMVSQQDITAGATDLKTSLEQSVQAALHTQVHADETLLTPVQCTQQVTPDQQPGAEAAQVSITVTETCHGSVYSTQAYQTAVMQIASQQAQKHLGADYVMQGDVQTRITQATPTGQGTVLLQVNIAATWQYQFTAAEQEQIKQRVAGKSKDQAIHALLHVPGVQTVSIASAQLPSDPRHIQLLFVVMP